MTIHNQENEAENEYYKTKQGEIGPFLASLGIDDAFFTPTGKSSLISYLPLLDTGRPLIFVHNTFSAREDIQYAQNRLKEPWWCLCPNANLYIENRLPDINMLIDEYANICIGTDSLASNHELCILSEIYTIKRYYPDITWEILIKWATSNGAAALQMHEQIGTLEPGKQPGIVLITGLDTSGKPKVKKII